MQEMVLVRPETCKKQTTEDGLWSFPQSRGILFEIDSAPTETECMGVICRSDNILRLEYGSRHKWQNNSYSTLAWIPGLNRVLFQTGALYEQKVRCILASKKLDRGLSNRRVIDIWECNHGVVSLKFRRTDIRT